MEIATIIMVIPILMTVGLILMVIRGFLTGDGANAGNVTKVVAAFLVLSIAIVLISNLSDTTVDHEDYDSDTNTLTIKANIVEADSYPWDGYASDVESLVINDGVTYIADGAFSNLTALEYVSISESVESITSSAFGVTLKDYLDQTITDPEAGGYVGTGNGTLYYADTSIYTYSTDKKTITGLTTEASAAAVLVLPSEYDGTTITAIGISAFKEKSITAVYSLPDCSIAALNTYAFQTCTSLATLDLPDSVETIGGYAVQGCTSLTSFDFPSELVTIQGFAFRGTTLTSLDLPDGLTTIGSQCFRECSSVESVYFPASIETVGNLAFASCTGVTSVTFADGYAATIDASFGAWTFYDSDGTTVIDKTVASDLAGYTFQGTASALIKVEPNRSTLTAAQTLQVQELTKAAALVKIDESEFQISEKEIVGA